MMGPMLDSKRISVILAGKMGKKEDAPEVKVEEDVSPELAAAKALLKALDSKNPKRIVDAFKNMIECCDMMDSTMEDDSEDME